MALTGSSCTVPGTRRYCLCTVHTGTVFCIMPAETQGRTAPETRSMCPAPSPDCWNLRRWCWDGGKCVERDRQWWASSACVESQRDGGLFWLDVCLTLNASRVCSHDGNNRLWLFSRTPFSIWTHPVWPRPDPESPGGGGRLVFLTLSCEWDSQEKAGKYSQGKQAESAAGKQGLRAHAHSLTSSGWSSWPGVLVILDTRTPPPSTQQTHFWWFAPGTGQAQSTKGMVYQKLCTTVVFSMKMMLNYIHIWAVVFFLVKDKALGRNLIRMHCFEIWLCSQYSCPVCWRQIMPGLSAYFLFLQANLKLPHPQEEKLSSTHRRNNIFLIFSLFSSWKCLAEDEIQWKSTSWAHASNGPRVHVRVVLLNVPTDARREWYLVHPVVAEPLTCRDPDPAVWAWPGAAVL